MTSRETIFGLGSIVGYFSLFIGVLGQAAFLSPVTKLHLPVIIAAMISLLPWLIAFLITFFKQSFLPPRQFRFCLFFAMCWFGCLIITAEILYHRGYIPPDNSSDAVTLSRVLMHIGWLSLLFVIPRYVGGNRYESKQDVSPIAETSRRGRDGRPASQD